MATNGFDCIVIPGAENEIIWKLKKLTHGKTIH